MAFVALGVAVLAGTAAVLLAAYLIFMGANWR